MTGNFLPLLAKRGEGRGEELQLYWQMPGSVSRESAVFILFPVLKLGVFCRVTVIFMNDRVNSVTDRVNSVTDRVNSVTVRVNSVTVRVNSETRMVRTAGLQTLPAA